MLSKRKRLSSIDSQRNTQTLASLIFFAMLKQKFYHHYTTTLDKKPDISVNFNPAIMHLHSDRLKTENAGGDNDRCRPKATVLCGEETHCSYFNKNGLLCSLHAL